MEEEIQPRRYFELLGKFPSLQTNHIQPHRLCSSWGLSTRYGVSGKTLEEEKRYS
jgi:hypothetical protein